MVSSIKPFGSKPFLITFYLVELKEFMKKNGGVFISPFSCNDDEDTIIQAKSNGKLAECSMDNLPGAKTK